MIRHLGTIRGLAIIAVVIGHASMHGMLALTYWGQRFGLNSPAPNNEWLRTPTYYGLIGLVQLSLFDVPLFLFASGIFVMYAARGNWLKLKLQIIYGWLKNLGFPWFTWMAVSIALYVITVVASPSGRQWELEAFVVMRARNYFFIIALGEFFILSPILVWLTLKKPRWLLVITALLAGIYSGMRYAVAFGLPIDSFLNMWTVGGWLYVWRLGFFFSLGLVAGRYGENFKRHLVSLRTPLFLAVLIFGFMSIFETEVFYAIKQQLIPDEPIQEGPIDYLLSIYLYATSAILFVYSWDWGRGRLEKFLGRLGGASLGIYLMHFVVLDLTSKLVYHIAPQMLPVELVYQPLLVFAGIGLPVLTMEAIERSPLRRYRRILLGS